MPTLPDFATQPTISVPEAAQLLGVNPRSVYNAVERVNAPLRGWAGPSGFPRLDS